MAKASRIWSFLELLPVALGVCIPSSPVSSPATWTTPLGNTKPLLTCLSTLQHRAFSRSDATQRITKRDSTENLRATPPV
ncbi:hypothetical protein GOODEAATRI_023532 [Goodea atripinnis]|uniref:Secreted protein n=1 Tax=Goodea atripinnis TaxID=208336 RepID=A0ABV0Q0G9_9TELE